MFVRVLQIKFPNELAKNSVNALSRDMTKEFFKSGLLLRFNTDTSPNSLMITLLWEKKELFDIARKKYGDKFVAEVKEMGGIVTISDGLSEIDRAKEIDLSKFNEF